MGVPMATSQDFVNWVPGKRLRSWYLAHVLIAGRDYLRGLSEGAIHKTIYMPTLAGLCIRLPSIAEQDRILARIDELRSGAVTTGAALNRQAAASTHSALLCSMPPSWENCDGSRRSQDFPR